MKTLKMLSIWAFIRKLSGIPIDTVLLSLYFSYPFFSRFKWMSFDFDRNYLMYCDTTFYSNLITLSVEIIPISYRTLWSTFHDYLHLNCCIYISILIMTMGVGCRYPCPWKGMWRLEIKILCPIYLCPAKIWPSRIAFCMVLNTKMKIFIEWLPYQSLFRNILIFTLSVL